jgi:hypothetical protein
MGLMLLSLAGRRVALGPASLTIPTSSIRPESCGVFQSWQGALGVYLLWRSGVRPTQIGLGRYAGGRTLAAQTWRR